MPHTQKLLVAFNPERPEEPSSDFLVPLLSEGRRVLHGLRSRAGQRYGLMVYIGRPITEHNLFAKLVDSGAEIGDADGTLASLREYLENLQSLRVGNVVRLRKTDGDSLELELLAKTPSGFRGT